MEMNKLAHPISKLLTHYLKSEKSDFATIFDSNFRLSSQFFQKNSKYFHNIHRRKSVKNVTD